MIARDVRAIKQLRSKKLRNSQTVVWKISQLSVGTNQEEGGRVRNACTFDLGFDAARFHP